MKNYFINYEITIFLLGEIKREKKPNLFQEIIRPEM